MAARCAFIIVFLPFLLNGQVLLGEYEEIENEMSSYCISFSPSDRFSIKSGNSTNHRTYISMGYFKVIKDTLILFHEPILSDSASIYVVQGQRNLRKQNGLSLSLSVVDREENAIKRVSVIGKLGNHVLFGSLTDENGKASIYTEGGIVEFIEVSLIGYEPVKIDLSEFWGFDTDLEIILTRANSRFYFNGRDRTEKFLYKKEKKTRLILESLDNQILRKLERVDN